MLHRITPLSASTILPMAALVACMDPTGYRDIGRTGGGSVNQVSLEVALQALDPDPICLPGPVYSAHTMYLHLGTDRLRTTPDTVWGFHGATSRTTGEWSESATRKLAESYPPALAEWFWSGPAYQHGADMTRVRGAWLIANGWAGEC